MGQTMQLAQLVADLNYDKLPIEVIHMAKRCVMDYLGCTIFATQTDMGKIITEFCKKGNMGTSVIFPDLEGKFDSSYAALANGTCAHGFELDDINIPSGSHPGAPVISAALALGQEYGVNGQRLIEAIVAGYEVMARVGGTIGGVAHINHGHHPTSSYGTFGAAAAGCKILGLNAEKTASAFGIAGSFASGLTQFSISGSMVKRIHAGKAAQQGVIVAQLADRGFTGPTDILEGKYGFCRVYRGVLKPEEINWGSLTDGIGEKYAIMTTAFKPSSTCGVIHAVIECIKKIKENPAFELNKVKEIVVRGHHNLVEHHNVIEPESILAAQYSLPFTVGLCMLHDIEDATLYLDNKILKDPGIIALAKRVTPVFDEEIQSLLPARFGAKVDIVLNEGTVLKHAVRDQKGSSGNPFTDTEIRRKFSNLAARVISPEAVNLIGDRVERLEDLDNVRCLTSLS